MPTLTLRDLVADRINGRWSDWSARHPHLAEAIDRVRLVDSAVTRLRNDPDFIEAMRAADLDEADLAKASHLLDQANKLVSHLLP